MFSNSRYCQTIALLGEIPRRHYRLVLRYGRTCEEMSGKILRYGTENVEQLHNVSTPCLDDHQFKRKNLARLKTYQMFVHRSF